MKEYIERSKATEEILSIPCGTIHTDYAVFIIGRIPAADVEPVVRCKDCKRWHPVPDEDGSRFCMRNQMWSAPKFFCAGGERKETAHMERSGSGE